MRDLVEDHLRQAGDVTCSWATPEEILLVINNQSDILHGTSCKLRRKDVIQLVERVLASEERAEIEERLFRHLMEAVVFKVCGERAPRPEADRDGLCATREAQLTSLADECACGHCEEVGGEWWRLSKGAQRTPVSLNGSGGSLGAVRQHHPLGWGEHFKRETRLDVWLIKERCHAVRLVGLKVCVDVFGAIFRIYEAEDPVATRVKGVLVLNLKPILRPALQETLIKGESISVPGWRCYVTPVEAHGLNRLASEAEEDRAFR